MGILLPVLIPPTLPFHPPLPFHPHLSHSTPAQACDGLWEVLSSASAVRTARRALFRHPGEPQRAADVLVAEATARGTTDNVTVLLVCFHQRESCHVTATSASPPVHEMCTLFI